MSVRAVVIIHRHGARLPSRVAQGNLSFPSSSKFWSRHGMNLTPAGCKQLELIGQELASLYPHLLVNKLHDRVRVFSSNTQRTIMSAVSLLGGMLPNYPVYITHNGDCRDHGDYSSVHHNMGIEISVEDSKYTDTLFHMNASQSEAYAKWKRNNVRRSPLLLSLTQDSRVLNLLDKLYTMTSCERLSPERHPVMRLCRITECVTLLRYSRLTNSPLIPNTLGLCLDQEEEAMINELSDVVYAHHFNTHNGGVRVGGSVVGQLLSSLCLFFEDVSSGEEPEGMRIYSGHDTTLLALASALGMDIQSPNFAGYFLFEYLDDDTVNVCYNSGGKSMSELEKVNVPLDVLGDITSSSNVRGVRNWMVGGQSLALTKSRREAENVFAYYDADGDGVISKEELRIALKRLGLRHVSSESLDSLYAELCAESPTGKIDLNLFLAARNK